MKKLILILIVLAGTTVDSYAQQAIWGGEQIHSPEVNSDQSVTFRVHAPNAATVQLMGDWMPSEDWVPGSADFEKNDDGLWTYTTDPLESDLYTYSLLVDGVRMTDPGNVHVVRDVASLFSMVIVEGGQGNIYKVNDVPHGSVTKRWYDSPTLEKERRITIYTPAGYENSTEDFPVLYLLHGMGGDEEAWISLGRTAQIMDNLIAEGKAEPMIVVMPNGNVSQQAAPGESADGFFMPQMMLPNTMDGEYERSFRDVIQFVEENYRVKEENSSRAIAGLSMGGFHSLHISRTYPGMFSYVGLFSPAVFPLEGSSSELYDDLESTLQKQNEDGFEYYLIAIGETDFLYDQVVEYRSILDSLDISYEYKESEGGHTWKNWRDYLSDFAPKLFKESSR